MSENSHDIKSTVRDFLFGIFNKEFLIFLFFLVLSSAYWLMSVLNDSMEREISVPVQLIGVPKDVVILGDSDISVRVVVRDKGYAVAAYLYGEHIKPAKLPFSVYARSNDKLSINSSELQKIIREQLYGSTRIISLKPDHLDIAFNHGLRKRVPVKMNGKIEMRDDHYLARVEFEPENVYIYASKHLIDSITNVFTVKQNFTGVADTIVRKVSLKQINGVKMVPSEVKMTLYTDIMTKGEVTINVTPINVPPGMILRTFPSQVKVSYVVCASQYNQVNESEFSVVADYASIADGTSDKCQLELVKSPRIVRNATLQVTEVSYLIEQ